MSIRGFINAYQKSPGKIKNLKGFDKLKLSDSEAAKVLAKAGEFIDDKKILQALHVSGHIASGLSQDAMVRISKAIDRGDITPEMITKKPDLIKKIIAKS